MKVKKIDKTLWFLNKKWLKPLYDSNTKLGAKTENKFQRNVSKTMNKSLSWIFAENVRERKTMLSAKKAEQCVKNNLRRDF